MQKMLGDDLQTVENQNLHYLGSQQSKENQMNSYRTQMQTML